MKVKQVLATLVLGMAAHWAAAEEFSHDVWDSLVGQHVISKDGGKSTMVDYGAFAQQRAQLKVYLDALSAVEESEFKTWPKDDQLAFLINAYNAWTVELILTAWPDIESIKDLGGLFSTPWEKAFIPLFAQEVSLDDIEHGFIRGSGGYNDPRIHFAVNCASVGCPALRAEAFTGEELDAQLAEQTKLFLSDHSRNRLQGNKIELSSIFKWYREDFEKGWLGYESLEQFLLDYRQDLALTDKVVKKLEKNNQTINFLKYDWLLNKTP